MERRVCVGRLKREGRGPRRTSKEEVNGQIIVSSEQPQARGLKDGHLGLKITKATLATLHFFNKKLLNFCTYISLMSDMMDLFET